MQTCNRLNAVGQLASSFLAIPYSVLHGLDGRKSFCCHAYSTVWFCAAHVRHGLLDLQLRIIISQGEHSFVKQAIGNDWKGKLSPILYATAILLAYVSQWFAIAIYISVALLWLVPDRRMERAVLAKETGNE